jgi:hypothetical protein
MYAPLVPARAVEILWGENGCPASETLAKQWAKLSKLLLIPQRWWIWIEGSPMAQESSCVCLGSGDDG